MSLAFRIRSMTNKGEFYSATVSCYDNETDEVIGDALTLNVDKHFKTRVLNAFKNEVAVKRRISQIKVAAQEVLDNITEEELLNHKIIEIRDKKYESILD